MAQLQSVTRGTNASPNHESCPIAEWVCVHVTGAPAEGEEDAPPQSRDTDRSACAVRLLRCDDPDSEPGTAANNFGNTHARRDCRGNRASAGNCHDVRLDAFGSN
jgi:hypothetical protein